MNEDSLYYSDSLWLIADGMGGRALEKLPVSLQLKKLFSNTIKQVTYQNLFKKPIIKFVRLVKVILHNREWAPPSLHWQALVSIMK